MLTFLPFRISITLSFLWDKFTNVISRLNLLVGKFELISADTRVMLQYDCSENKK